MKIEFIYTFHEGEQLRDTLPFVLPILFDINYFIDFAASKLELTEQANLVKISSCILLDNEEEKEKLGQYSPAWWKEYNGKVWLDDLEKWRSIRGITSSIDAQYLSNWMTNNAAGELSDKEPLPAVKNEALEFVKALHSEAALNWDKLQGILSDETLVELTRLAETDSVFPASYDEKKCREVSDKIVAALDEIAVPDDKEVIGNTNTPWTYRRDSFGERWEIVADNGLVLMQHTFDGQEAEANAKLICEAVNNYPAAIKALGIMTALCRIKYGNLDKDVYAEIEKAEQLLQKAKENTL